MSHPDAMVTYPASNMILSADSDTSYLSETKARSRAGGHFFLSEDNPTPRNNGAILTIAQTCHVFCCRSRTRRSIHQCVRDQTTTTPPQQDGTSTTAHAGTN